MAGVRGLLTILGICAALAIAGCGSSSSSSSSGGGELTESSSSSSATVSGVSTDLKKRPTIEVPSGPPPKKLESVEIVEGTGAEAKAGDTITVQYDGVDYKTGKEFDASWDRSEPFTFGLGNGEVIKGWDQGLVGMKEGGRRELIIPPELAYGAEGSPPVIAPNATLVFVVDLLKVE